MTALQDVHRLPNRSAEQETGFASRLMDLLVVPTYVLDELGRVVLWNRACERLTGVPAAEVLGTANHGRSFHDGAHPTLADQLLQQRSSASAHAEDWFHMPRIGKRCYLSIDACPVFGHDGTLQAVLSTLRDMTDEKTAQLVLEQLATRDGLTGLANRRCFDETLHAEWQRAMRQKTPLSLLMVDVDNFKQYNDAHGHLGGDECLKRIAQTVACEMRANDLVARYGGEEFAVILPSQDLKGAAIVAERIRRRVERLNAHGDLARHPQVTVSIGAATALAAPGDNASELVATADAALYRAKHMGRNRISLPLASEPA
jgi:diguanylate cyclase (GGDEF)-like protein/PAS domain S-box-containing protein